MAGTKSRGSYGLHGARAPVYHFGHAMGRLFLLKFGIDGLQQCMNHDPTDPALAC